MYVSCPLPAAYILDMMTKNLIFSRFLIDRLVCLQLEYFETILNPYFTSDARDSLKSLQGLLLEKATESVTDAVDNPGHNRRPTRGSEDALADDKQQGTTVSPDELIVSN